MYIFVPIKRLKLFNLSSILLGFGDNLLQDNLDQLANVAAAQATTTQPPPPPKVEEPVDDGKTEEEKVSEVNLQFLAHLSRRLTGELIVYPCSVVRRRRPSFTISKIFSSETAWPIKAKLHVEHP